MFGRPFPNAFGLDIGDLSIKLVQLRNVSSRRRGASFHLMEHRSIDLPHGLIANGEIQEPERIRKYLHHILGHDKRKYKPIKGSWVVASLPETQSFLKHISVQKAAEDIEDEDIVAVAKKHIPFGDDDSYIDWQVVPSKNNTTGHTEVIIGAIEKSIANSYTYLLESLGLGVMAIEIEALSIARAMITASKEYDNEARALLDFGATRSSLVVYDHESIQFSTSLPFSGELLTTALSQKLGLSYKEAEQRKIEVGLDTKKHRGKAHAILREQTDRLAKEAKKALHFYETHFEGANKVTHITMSGGTANLPLLDQALTQTLGIQTSPGRPWKNLHSKKEIAMDPRQSLSYATAIGLALRAADNPFFQHDTI